MQNTLLLYGASLHRPYPHRYVHFKKHNQNQHKSTYHAKNSKSNIKFQEFSRSVGHAMCKFLKKAQNMVVNDRNYISTYEYFDI